MISAKCCLGTTALGTGCCYVGSAGDPDGAARRPAKSQLIRLRIESNELHDQMSVAPQHSRRRDADGTRPVRSTRPISVPLFGKMRQIKLSVLLPVVFAANVAVAAVAWYIVGLLMR
jgi:hypothetical protein